MEPRIVVIGLVYHFDRYAMLQRQDGSWTFPSGKRHANESKKLAGQREIKEETGLDTLPECSLAFSKQEDGTHLVYYLFRYVSGVLCLCEPDKFKSIGWFTEDEVREKAGDKLNPDISLAMDEIREHGFDAFIERHYKEPS